MSVRNFEGRLGIQWGKIVDCGDCSGVRWICWQVSAKEKAREFRHRGPLICVGVSFGASRQSKMMNLNRIQ
jgi:hypothetical protein